MENLVWTEKLGIYDEELLEINPKLIIVHVSGYGPGLLSIRRRWHPVHHTEWSQRNYASADTG